MRQTVVGVFETSDEARRAQAALLDAQFQPASIRVSAGGTPRGVDEGMAYPSTAGFDGDFLTGPPASPRRAPHHLAGVDEGPLERLSEFFRDLFSPEDQQMEMARYEEAIRRGGTLVAVDVEDDLEERLASDILIRAGAYDLEERARSWGRPDYAADDVADEDIPRSHAGSPAQSAAAQPRMSRSAAMPGNVTSMDPLDPTGYVASRADTTGSGMPRGAVAWPGDGTEADRMEFEQREAARLEADRIEADRIEAARRETQSAQAADREAQRRYTERLEAERVRARTQTPGSGSEMFLDEAGFASRRGEAITDVPSSQREGPSPISRNVRIYSRRADDLAALRPATVDDDRMAPSTARNLPLREAAVREETLSPELMPDEWSAMATTQRASAVPPQPAAPRWDSPPDSPLAAQTPTPAVRTDWSGTAPVDPGSDVRSELGLRSPLEDKGTAHRRVLDDGAPFASDPYDDDDRRYAEGTGSEYGAQTGLADTREPHSLQNAEGSEWAHIKRVVRDAWHRVTGHHH